MIIQQGKFYCHHRITFDVIDGQPDIDTIRMEVLA